MKSWRLAISLVALAASGCTVGQHRTELTALQNENRELEDNLYQQQAALKDLCQQLDACRKDNAELRHRLQTLNPSGPQTAASQPPAPAAEAIKPPSVEPGQRVSPGHLPARLQTLPAGPGAGALPEAPEVPEEEPTGKTDAPAYPSPNTSPPATEPPSSTPSRTTPPAAAPAGAVPPGATPPGTKPSSEGSSASARGSLRTVAPSPPLGRALQGDNTKVEAITIRPVAAGGHRAEPSPGGDGIALWIEPRDQAGNLVRAAAPVAVVVLDPDPSMVGPAARIGRWDFASEATAAFYRKTAAAEGIFLELTWPGDPPKHRTLEVFVRYTTDDGRKIEARRAIHLDPANQPAVEPHSTWSRRPAPAPVATTAYPSANSPAATEKERSAASDALPPQRPRKSLSSGDEAEKSKLDPPTWSPDRGP